MACCRICGVVFSVPPTARSPASPGYCGCSSPTRAYASCAWQLTFLGLLHFTVLMCAFRWGLFPRCTYDACAMYAVRHLYDGTICLCSPVSPADPYLLFPEASSPDRATATNTVTPRCPVWTCRGGSCRGDCHLAILMGLIGSGGVVGGSLAQLPTRPARRVHGAKLPGFLMSTQHARISMGGACLGQHTPVASRLQMGVVASISPTCRWKGKNGTTIIESVVITRQGCRCTAGWSMAP